MIAITGASGQVGTLVGERLAAEGREARPLDRGDDWVAGIVGAEVVVHLAGTLQPRKPDDYESANVDTARTAAGAARDAGARRIVFLSYVGADPGSGNAYLRAKAAAEGLLHDSGVPVTILRCLHIFGTPERPGPTAGAFLARGGRSVAVPGSGRQRIEPLYIGDVATAVLHATRPDSPTGTFELSGPEQLSMDEFVRAINGGAVRIRHLPAPIARLAGRFSAALTPALIDLLLRDNVASSPAATAGEAFGFTPTRLADVWPAAR